MKKYDTLRPFQALEAEPGDKLFSTLHGDVVVYIAGPDERGGICVTYNGIFSVIAEHVAKYNPVCWVENKPVYNGDVLHFISPLNPTFAGNFQIDRIGHTTEEVFLIRGGWVYIKDLTWVLPKTKHVGWLNVYPNNRVHNDIHNTKEIADQMAFNHRIDCIKIEYLA